jgi:pyruvate kinase
METYRFENGRVIRRVKVSGTAQKDRYTDDQLLKTKIVASLGKPDHYAGRLGLDARRGAADYAGMYEDVVKTFYDNGVDVIRLNLSHRMPVPLSEAFAMIKSAILKVERKSENRKRIAVLADLPGPKIRFEKRKDNEVEMVFTVGKPFTVHFRKKVKAAHGATVFLDGLPLEEGLAAASRHGGQNDRAGISDDEDPQRVENALGGDFVPAELRGGSLGAVMEQVRSRLEGSEPVLVMVGDGEVVMEVNREKFDPGGTTLPCRVVSVRAEQDNEDKDAAPSMPIKDAKGFTIKGIDFDIPSFTVADKKILGELLAADYTARREEGWEPVLTFVALSFAQTADDVMRVKKFIECELRDKLPDGKARLQSPSIIAKIETRKGWDNRKYVLDVADGIMVARGDLGLQVDIEEVPGFQKRLIRLCNKRGKPVITATQMLSSMTKSVEPTRAEATDVFNAIFDGSDAVMMSEETASGKYPLESIRKMIGIAVRAEWYFERRGMSNQVRRDVNLRRFQEFLEDEPRRVKADLDRFNAMKMLLLNRNDAITQRGPTSGLAEESARLAWRAGVYGEKSGKASLQPTTDRITQATCTMSEGDDIKGIIAATTSGRTVRMISRLRPSVLLAGAAHDPINTRKLAVSYGVLPICIGELKGEKGTEVIFEHCHDEIEKDVYLRKHLPDDATVIFTAGTKLGHPGTTNVIQMRRIREDTSP